LANSAAPSAAFSPVHSQPGIWDAGVGGVTGSIKVMGFRNLIPPGAKSTRGPTWVKETSVLLAPDVSTVPKTEILGFLLSSSGQALGGMLTPTPPNPGNKSSESE